MFAVTLYLSIDSLLIKLLCRFVNFEEIIKEIYKMIHHPPWREGGMHQGPPSTPLHIPDLDHVPDHRNAVLISSFFSNEFPFHVRSSNNHSNIFKKAFYVFVCFFGTMGMFLIIPFILMIKNNNYPEIKPSPIYDVYNLLFHDSSSSKGKYS